jgi:hypothetical protein
MCCLHALFSSTLLLRGEVVFSECGGLAVPDMHISLFSHQELPHSDDTAPHPAKKKRGRESMVYKMTNFKTDTTNNLQK